MRFKIGLNKKIKIGGYKIGWCDGFPHPIMTKLHQKKAGQRGNPSKIRKIFLNCLRDNCACLNVFQLDFK